MNEASDFWQNRQFSVLAFSDAEPHWLNLTLQLDTKKCHSPRFEWVSSLQETIQATRTRQFDLLIFGLPQLTNLGKEVLSPLKAFQASGLNCPILLLTAEFPRSEQVKALQSDLEFLLDPLMWDSPLLLASIEKSRRLHQLRQEHQKWGRQLQATLSHEQLETEQLLKHQTELLDQLKSCRLNPNEQLRTRTAGWSQSDGLEKLSLQYSELLKKYVVQDPEELVQDINQLIEQVVSAGISPTTFMQLHLEQTQALIIGLGNRSGKHVLASTDRLALNLMIRLAETFQNRQQKSQRL